MKVLAISPHTDDSEIGAGGLISKLKSQGVAIDHLVLCNAFESLDPIYPKNQLLNEAEEASNILGFSDLKIHDFPVRKFSEFRQELLELFFKISKKRKYGKVLIPSSYDIHQDHQVVHLEAVRAFKDINILGYELPWNNIKAQYNYFVELNETHLEKKAKAIECYKSQSERHYVKHKTFWDLAKLRGAQIKKQYAEAYEVIRLMD